MKGFLLKILLAVVFLSSGCAYYNTFFNAKKYYKDAEKERQQRLENLKKRGQSSSQNLDKPSSNELKNYDKSIEKASKVLEIYSKSKYVDDALFLLGKCFFRKEEYEKAARKFLELIDNFPKSDLYNESQLWLAKTNIESRDYSTAEKNLRNILNSKVRDEIRDEAQFLLGGLFKHKGDYITAIDEYETAAKRAQDRAIRANAYYEMGESYYQLKNFAQAVESFKQARKYSPDEKFEFNAMLRAGWALKDMQKYDEAIKIFTSLLGDAVNEENWPICRLEIAHCHRLQEDWDNAIGWYLDITTQHQKSEEAAVAFFYLGKIYLEQKSEYQFAKDYFEKAIAENPRAEINSQANALSKSIQRLLALKADIIAQQRKIALGDSIAAVMDSVDTGSSRMSLLQQSNFDSLNADSSRFNPDSLSARLDSLDNQDQNPDDFRQADRFNRNQNIPPQNQKIVLKTGELGTPREELLKDKLLLGEIYLFEFDQPDSALKEYVDVLEMDTSRAIIPKTLFTIGYICENIKKDTTLADSVYQRLINFYPDHPLAQQAKKKIRTIKVPDLEAPIAESFRKAEQAYLVDRNFRSAISTFETIYQNHPNSDFAPKSLLAMGWIYENSVTEPEKALAMYQNLLDNYPNSTYAISIKRKVEEVKKARSAPDVTKDDLLADKAASIQETKNAGSDSLNASAGGMMDKESYHRFLRLEMEKNDPRRKTPRRW
ncbi:MAG TPA: tetratricopeptide repeat protein [bacterium]